MSQTEEKAQLPRRPSGEKLESQARPSDAELGNSSIVPETPKKKSKKEKFFTKLFGSDYDLKESTYVLLAAIVIAINAGFINGVCMSGLLIVTANSEGDENPKKQMVAGFAGAFTNCAIFLLEGNWPKYFYNLGMIASYMGGAFIAAMINAQAKPYVIEPRYGPTFMIGGVFLLTASLFAKYEFESRFIFFLSTASLGIQNGIASLYSANLIRCTLTGAVTDIGIVLAQAFNCHFKGFARGCVLTIIVFNFWLGGLVSYYAVRAFRTETLFFSAALFFFVGLIQVFYLVKELGVSVHDAFFGTWKWKKVLKKLDTEDGDLTPEKLIRIFEKIDQDGDGNGQIDADELRIGLRAAKIQMTDYEIKTLFRAADDDGDGTIDEDEWKQLVAKIL